MRYKKRKKKKKPVGKGTPSHIFLKITIIYLKALWDRFPKCTEGSLNQNQHQKPRNGFSLSFHSSMLIKVIVNDRHTWPNLLKKQHGRWPEHWRSSVPLCIFTAACKIDWVLIVFPRVLEGSARGIDQPLTKPLALRALHGLSLWCRQTEIKELKMRDRK